MNTVTAIAWGAGGLGLIGIVWLVLRWRVAAERVSQVEQANATWVEHSKRLQAVTAAKEAKIVEVEKAMLASKSGAELSSALNELLRRPAGAAPKPGPAKGKTGTPRR